MVENLKIRRGPADGGTVRDLVKAKQNSVEAQNYRSVMPWKAGGGRGNDQVPFYGAIRSMVPNHITLIREGNYIFSGKIERGMVCVKGLKGK